MMSFRKMWFACVLGSFLAAAGMAVLVGYMFEAAPVEGALAERAPLPGRLEALLNFENGPPAVDVTVDPEGVDVTVGRPAAVERCPTCGAIVDARGVAVTVDPVGPSAGVTITPGAQRVGLPGIGVLVDPAGVGVNVNPLCPPGGCPDQPEPGTPDAYPSGYTPDPDYDEFADGGSDPGGGHGGGFRGVFKFGKLRERLQAREGGPLRRLFGKLGGCGK